MRRRVRSVLSTTEKGLARWGQIQDAQSLVSRLLWLIRVLEVAWFISTVSSLVASVLGIISAFWPTLLVLALLVLNGVLFALSNRFLKLSVAETARAITSGDIVVRPEAASLRLTTYPPTVKVAPATEQAEETATRGHERATRPRGYRPIVPPSAQPNRLPVTEKPPEEGARFLGNQTYDGVVWTGWELPNGYIDVLGPYCPVDDGVRLFAHHPPGTSILLRSNDVEDHTLVFPPQQQWLECGRCRRKFYLHATTMSGHTVGQSRDLARELFRRPE